MKLLEKLSLTYIFAHQAVGKLTLAKVNDLKLKGLFLLNKYKQDYITIKSCVNISVAIKTSNEVILMSKTFLSRMKHRTKLFYVYNFTMTTEILNKVPSLSVQV